MNRYIFTASFDWLRRANDFALSFTPGPEPTAPQKASGVHVIGSGAGCRAGDRMGTDK